MLRPLVRAAALALALAAGLEACDTATPLQPVHRNHVPVVQSLTAFPTTLAPGDSAVVVCSATDADGDRLYFDWYSDCRLLKKGSRGGDILTGPPQLVVYAGTCGQVPLDTGWVHCEVWDGKSGFVEAGTVRIVIRQ